MTDNSVVIDVESKCPKCEHKYLTRVRFTRRVLLGMLRVIRNEGQKKKKVMK